MNRKSSVVTTRKLLAVMLLVTAANVFTFTHRETSARYILNVHHNVAKWTSFPAILDRFVHNSPTATSPSSEAENVSYKWVPSDRTGPLAPEPGIDSLNAGAEGSLPARRITGAPGSDFWSQEDVDEDLVTIFNVEDFTERDEVRSVISSCVAIGADDHTIQGSPCLGYYTRREPI